MTTKEASGIFHLDVKEIQNRAKNGMIIDAVKEKGRWKIPDNTAIIPSKEEIIHFLLQILKFKNNPATVISRSLCPDDKSLHALMDYIYRRGFIGEYQFSPDMQKMLRNVSLTDDGFEFVFGEKMKSNMVAINVNPSLISFSIL